MPRVYCTYNHCFHDLQWRKLNNGSVHGHIGIGRMRVPLCQGRIFGCHHDINSKLLKNTIAISSKFLYLIFNQSLNTGTLPDDWKKAKIVPIFKAGRRESPANYRPISLTSVPSKILEHIIASNLMASLESVFSTLYNTVFENIFPAKLN